MASDTQVRIVSRQGLLGGEPCFEGTRIPAALIKNLMSGKDAVTAERIAYFYPSLAGLDLDGWLADV